MESRKRLRLTRLVRKRLRLTRLVRMEGAPREIRKTREDEGLKVGRSEGFMKRNAEARRSLRGAGRFLVDAEKLKSWRRLE